MVKYEKKKGWKKYSFIIFLLHINMKYNVKDVIG